MKYYLLPLLGLLVTGLASAQTKIKDGTVVGSPAQPQANAVLELESTNKGLLLPRLQLASTTNFTPLTAHVAGMTVYNTATAGAGATAVSPGFYYNDGTKWVRIASNFTETVTTLTSTNNGNSFTYVNELGIPVTIDLLAGPIGPAGPAGPQGIPGVVGVEGQPGQTGTPGIPGSGTPGAPGTGVTIVNNNSGTWVFNPNDSSWTNINGPAGPVGPAGPIGPQGNDGAEGPQGIPGVVGVEGQPGQTGTPGIPGSGAPGAPGTGVMIVNNNSGTWVFNPNDSSWTNINGPVGPVGPAGPIGPQGNDGAEGPQGPVGSAGPIGPEGPQGIPGVVGVEGQPGQTGTPGIPGSGTPGAPGSGVTIVNNNSGTWVFNPNDSSWTNINGPVGPVGPAGPIGPQGNDGAEGPQGPVGSAGPIGPEGPQGIPGVVGVEGQPGQTGTPGIPGSGTPGAPGSGVTIVNNNSGTWVFNPNDSSWTNINGPVGPVGPAGPIGPQGNDGAEGPQGPAGSIGMTGPAGPIGPQGNDGPEGPQGIPGVVGVEGQPGQTGTPGIPGSGAPGAPGTGVTIVNNNSGTWVFNPNDSSWTNINGPVGPAGPIGPQGNDGAEGPQGPAGSTGMTGPAGPIGPQGNDGAEGPQGPAGSIGMTGPAGPIGPQGNDGPEGPQGIPGVVGVEGQPGQTGTPGIPGSGTPGAPGSGVTIVNNNSGTWVFNPNDSSWTNINGPVGPAGPAGPEGMMGPVGPAGPVGVETNTTLEFNSTTGDLTYLNEQFDNPVINLSSLAVEPWLVQGTGEKATDNTQDIYQMGNVGIGTTTPAGKLHVYSDSLATTPIFEKATTNIPEPGFALAVLISRQLANLNSANLAGYTGNGSWVSGSVTMGQNYSIKSATDAQIDIAGISAGLIDYNNKKGQLNFFVNGGISGTNSTPPLGLNAPAMVLSTDGYLGIGTATGSLVTYSAPTNKLHVKTTGTINPVRFENLQASVTPNTDKIVVADANGVLKTLTASNLAIEPWMVQGSTAQATTNAQNIYQQGSVAIGVNTVPSFVVGTTTIQPKLHIAGDVSSTGKFYTTSSVYADYVFEKYFNGSSDIKADYEFRSLAYVKDFIKKNNHLPGVTPISGINKSAEGYSVNMTELTIQSLEKIEELYLHTIEQQEKIEKQQTEINEMKARLERLETLLLNNK